MEGQSKVHIRELLLRVEVCPARDDPPAFLVGVDVPHVVAGIENGLRVDLLHESHFEVGRLPFKVFPDFLDFLFGSFQHDLLPRRASRTALQRFAKTSSIDRCRRAFKVRRATRDVRFGQSGEFRSRSAIR
jgi:hypothetical protein